MRMRAVDKVGGEEVYEERETWSLKYVIVIILFRINIFPG